MRNTKTIQQDQIDEAQKWERMLSEGACSLNDALYMCMASGAPISQYILDRYEAAITDYNEGVYEDLAEAFGIKQTRTQKNVLQKKWRKDLQIESLVEHYNKLGYPKSMPIKGSEEKTAFDLVAEELDQNAQSIFKDYYAYQKQKKTKEVSQ